jgi:hypothetical protein
MATRHRCKGAFILLALSLFPAACSPEMSNPVRTAAHVSQIGVELDAFSGRPNPTWTLAPQLARTVRDALSDSRSEAPPLAVPGNLGYRGFIVRHDGQEVRVYKGRILFNDAGRARTVFDAEGVEALLAADARQRGFADVVPTP